MQVVIGNANAIEGYRDPTSGDPEKVQYRRVPGERTTTIVFPEDIGLQEAFVTTLGAVNEHMVAIGENGEPNKPAWVQCDSPGLLSLLLEHWGITAKQNVRPRTWGQEG